MAIYDFNIRKMDGTEISMEEYKGKVLLIVNTATGCGFTPQYTDLQNIYTKFKDKGFEILDFPCNQFLGQAPESDEEIHTICTGRFGITFPQFAKIDVNGENATPLYKWLVENTTFEGFGKGIRAKVLKRAVKANEKGAGGENDIKWNFTKFIIDREGNILGRYEPTVDMETVEQKVEEALG